MCQMQQTIKKFIPGRQRTHKSFLSWLPARHTNASELQPDCSFLFRNKRSTKQHSSSDTHLYFKVPELGSDKHVWCFAQAQALLRFKWHFYIWQNFKGRPLPSGSYSSSQRGKKVTHVCLLWSLKEAALTKWNKLNDNFYGADLERTTGIKLNTCSYHRVQKVYSSPVYRSCSLLNLTMEEN